MYLKNFNIQNKILILFFFSGLCVLDWESKWKAWWSKTHSRNWRNENGKTEIQSWSAYKRSMDIRGIRARFEEGLHCTSGGSHRKDAPGHNQGMDIARNDYYFRLLEVLWLFRQWGLPTSESESFLQFRRSWYWWEIFEIINITINQIHSRKYIFHFYFVIDNNISL